MNLSRFINDSPDRWQRAIALAQETRPHVSKIGPGTYRVARRIPPAPKRDAEFRLYFVELSTNGRDCFAECTDRNGEQCRGVVFAGVCRHIAACYQYEIKRAMRAERKDIAA